MAHCAILLVLLIALFKPSAAAAQPTVELRGPQTCSCDIHAELVVTLSDPDGKAGLSAPLSVVRLRNGSFLVVPLVQQSAILHFSESGSFLRRIGRSGRGPGEFTAVLRFASLEGDTTAVLDPANRRITLLDPALRPARSIQLPFLAGRFIWLHSASIILLGSPPGIRDRLHVLDVAGSIVRSFAVDPAVRSSDQTMGPARIASTANGQIALSYRDTYTIELWDTAGRRTKTIVRNPEWLAPSSRRDAASPDDPPRPNLGDPTFHADNLLWTVSYVADPEWRSATIMRPDAYGRLQRGVREGSADSYWDSIVEILDVDGERLVASQRIDAHLRFIDTRGHAASYRQDEHGNPFIDIWKLSMRLR